MTLPLTAIAFRPRKPYIIRMEVITRFAPSPTGHLHLGHAYAAWLAWRRARENAGSFLLRLEDIDTARCKPEYAISIVDDLRWLGLDWDGETRLQSSHLPDYRKALQTLDARGVLYPCFCSRAEIARALSAPHNREQRYPGTCRNLSPAERQSRMAEGKNYAWRLDTARALALVSDFGFYEEDIGWIDGNAELLSDAVLARRDQPASYHLCVVHDDALQNISHVTRGRDLFEATHIHVLLQRLLNLPSPNYAHHRLLTDDSNQRLSKRDRAVSLRALRESGISAGAVLERLRRIDLAPDFAQGPA
jgi:glutamyl-Q tRNA(Asp) synthetase